MPAADDTAPLLSTDIPGLSCVGIAPLPPLVLLKITGPGAWVGWPDARPDAADDCSDMPGERSVDTAMGPGFESPVAGTGEVAGPPWESVAAGSPLALLPASAALESCWPPLEPWRVKPGEMAVVRGLGSGAAMGLGAISCLWVGFGGRRDEISLVIESPGR